MSKSATAAPVTRRALRTSVSYERILDSAVEVLIESGYAGASTLEIQRRAGVTRGRLTHHFPSRDRLLVAAVHHLASSRFQQLAAAQGSRVTAAPGSLQRVDQAINYIWTNFRQPYFWAATELWLAARHSPDLASALLPEEKRLYARVREMVDDAFGPVLTRRPGYKACRELILTSMRGVAITYAFDDRDPKRDANLRHWREAARHLLEVDTSNGDS